MIFPFCFDTEKLEFVPCPPAIIPFTPPSSQLINENPAIKGEYAIKQSL